MAYSWVMLDKIVGIVLDNVEGCIVEIGIGESTKILSYFSKLFNREFFTCDTSLGRCEWIKDIIKNPNMKVFFGTSFDFMKQFQGNPAVVLLDGRHDYASIRTESDFFLEKMNPGGVMFIHDTCPHSRTYERKLRVGKSVDSHIARKELEKREDVDCLTWRYTASGCGLTMVLKKDMNEPFYRT